MRRTAEFENISLFDLVRQRNTEEYYQWACSYEYYCRQRKTTGQDEEFYISTVKMFFTPKSQYTGNLDIRASSIVCEPGQCRHFAYCESRHSKEYLMQKGERNG
ncbi:MAG: hypothetical protein IKB62_01190 [Oscillospiraceae bacterium]|nr:hypothetical protein [Oscillospiraceae bacterium]